MCLTKSTKPLTLSMETSMLEQGTDNTIKHEKKKNIDKKTKFLMKYKGLTTCYQLFHERVLKVLVENTSKPSL